MEGADLDISFRLSTNQYRYIQIYNPFYLVIFDILSSNFILMFIYFKNKMFIPKIVLLYPSKNELNNSVTMFLFMDYHATKA